MTKEVRKCSKELQTELDACTSKAAQIRLLASKKWEVADIARKVGVIYQHAWNESHRPLKSIK